MLIGIISDTHDDMASIRKAVDFLNARGVSHVLHAGDLVSPFTFEIFLDLNAPFTGIFGNNDGDKLLLMQQSKGKIYNQPHLMTLGGSLKIAVVHEPNVVEALGHSGQYDLVIYGHTHTPDIRRVGKALIINPGKVAKLHKGMSTLVLLDAVKMTTELIEL